jgi:hypothetical protein
MTAIVNVAVSPASVTESGTTNLTYTFTRSGDTSLALTVNIDLGGTATAADYVTTSLGLASEPTKAWTKLLGSSGDDQALALTTGLDGSIYVSGYTSGALDGQTNSGSNDAFVTKYSADGTKAWTKLLGSSREDEGDALTTGLDGSIYVSGLTGGALDGQTYSGNLDAFLTKYSADGTKVWTKLLGSNGTDWARALTTGLDGSIYVGGFTNGAIDGQTNSGNWDAFLTKYSADGTKAWTNLLGAIEGDYAEALTTGLDGSIYVSGATRNALDGQTNSGGVDAFLTKYSADGTKAWTKLLGSSGNDGAYALTTGLDGSIYVSGYTYGALDGQTNSGGSDAFLTKYSVDGTKAWTKLLGSSGDEFPIALTTGLDGSIYVSGYAYGALDGQTNSGSVDAFLTKYSADGTKAWTKLLGSSREDWGRALTTGLDGSIYVSGYTSGALDGQTNSGNADSFLTMYLVSPQIFFAAGSSTATLVVDPTPDSLIEGSETAIVSVLAGQGYTVGAAAATTGSIVDANQTPTYSITGGSNSVNEGATATFTLTTTDVASGTSVPYTLSGVSAADITGGSLTGSATVNSGGTATIYIFLAADQLTESAETLTVTAGSASASTTVNDTSTTPAPIYAIISSSFSVNEGATATFTLTTTNVASGTSVPYTLSGVSVADITGESLTGSATVNSGGTATIAVPISADLLTEGAETLTVTAGGASASTTVNDTSTTPAPTYAISSAGTSVNEGSIATFTLTTANVSSGTSVPYTLFGVSTVDITGGLLSGTATVNSNGTATIAVPIAADTLTEGAETLIVTAGGASASTTVNDTSTIPAATYAISSSGSSVNEGYTAAFTLTTTNVAVGILVPYTVSGVTAADITGGVLSGTATVVASGTATIFVLLAADLLTEGAETLTVTAGGASASTTVNDTSKTPVAAYSLVTNSSAATEGTSVVATLSTTNVAPGSTLYYQITGTGITTTDLSGLALSGSGVVNSAGQVAMNMPLANDLSTEGSETLYLQYYTDSAHSSASGNAAAVTIYDTSTAPAATYAITSGNTSINEGGPASFTLTTTNVAVGALVPYTVSGVTVADITGGVLSGTATVDASGTAKIYVLLAADLLTEGAETLTVTAGGASASTTVNDTSKTPVATYSLVTELKRRDGRHIGRCHAEHDQCGARHYAVLPDHRHWHHDHRPERLGAQRQRRREFVWSGGDDYSTGQRPEH